jgi:hypothetical protein
MYNDPDDYPYIITFYLYHGYLVSTFDLLQGFLYSGYCLRRSSSSTRWYWAAHGQLDAKYNCNKTQGMYMPLRYLWNDPWWLMSVQVFLPIRAVVCALDNSGQAVNWLVSPTIYVYSSSKIHHILYNRYKYRLRYLFILLRPLPVPSYIEILVTSGQATTSQTYLCPLRNY